MITLNYTLADALNIEQDKEPGDHFRENGRKSQNK